MGRLEPFGITVDRNERLGTPHRTCRCETDPLRCIEACIENRPIERETTVYTLYIRLSLSRLACVVYSYTAYTRYCTAYTVYNFIHPPRPLCIDDYVPVARKSECGVAVPSRTVARPAGCLVDLAVPRRRNAPASTARCPKTFTTQVRCGWHPPWLSPSAPRCWLRSHARPWPMARASMALHTHTHHYPRLEPVSPR